MRRLRTLESIVQSIWGRKGSMTAKQIADLDWTNFCDYREEFERCQQTLAFFKAAFAFLATNELGAAIAKRVAEIVMAQHYGEKLTPEIFVALMKNYKVLPR